MKNLEGFGKTLSKDQQRQIIGGKGIVVCTCKGSDMDTTVCSFQTFTGLINCAKAAGNYCIDKGYVGASCDFSTSL